MGESPYGRVLLCPDKLSAWDKAVSPGAPIGERGIFLNRPLPHSVSVVVRTGGRPPHERLYCCGAVLAVFDDLAQHFQEWQHHHLIPSDRQCQ